MYDNETQLAILGAAEGSYFGTYDVRYKASFAKSSSHKSGLSFGASQLDTTSQAGYNCFSQIINAVTANEKTGVCSPNYGVCVPSADAAKILTNARLPWESSRFFTKDVTNLINQVFALSISKMTIDSADIVWMTGVSATIEAMLDQADAYWRQSLYHSPSLQSASLTRLPLIKTNLSPGTKGRLYFFAYLMASYNRAPVNGPVFSSWLTGHGTSTYGGPKSGWQLKRPPTISDLHGFLKSLKMWSAGQGNYDGLMQRMEPTLQSIANRQGLTLVA